MLDLRKPDKTPLKLEPTACPILTTSRAAPRIRDPKRAARQAGLHSGWRSRFFPSSSFPWPVFRLLGSIYLSDGDYSHGFLIPVIAGFFWDFAEGTGLRWPPNPHALEDFPDVLRDRSDVLGWCTKWLYVRDITDTHSWMGSPPDLWTGLLWRCSGTDRLRVLIFPLAYFGVCHSAPMFRARHPHAAAAHMVVLASASVLRGAGIPVFREGNVLHLAHGSLGVDEACSGIRSVWVLAATAVALVTSWA